MYLAESFSFFKLKNLWCTNRTRVSPNLNNDVQSSNGIDAHTNKGREARNAVLRQLKVAIGDDGADRWGMCAIAI
jgi:hypothetical protein